MIHIKILSLFDGMACGMLAMQGAGVQVDKYVAYEINKYAIKVATHNFPMIEERGDVFQADFTEFEGYDFMIGGSPCTYWSIAQKNNRETEASGLGWELFCQYVRALKEAKPRYFIYENNYSMSKQIRASIDKAFGFEAIYINSALVSAQNRQRLYWVGKRNEDGTYSKVNVEQPVDRGILLRDVLDNAITWQNKSYCITATEWKGSSVEHNINKHVRTMVAEPIRIGTMPLANGEVKDSQGTRIYSIDAKSVTQTANGGGLGAKTGLYAEPVACRCRGRIDKNGNSYAKYECRNDEKANTLDTNTVNGSMIAEPIKNNNKNVPIYKVENGLITIKDKKYPIKLQDGYYIIRKLTVSECKRLQTVPEWYDMSIISNTQAYKCLGNGWTVDVIIHLINACLSK